MKIRFYRPKTVKAYRSALRSFLRWFGNMPHRVKREDVREYLLVWSMQARHWVNESYGHIRTSPEVIEQLIQEGPNAAT